MFITDFIHYNIGFWLFWGSFKVIFVKISQNFIKSHLKICLISQISVHSLWHVCAAWPVEAKFHVEPPWDGSTKVCSNGPGHMTNMATMLIYGKNIKKIFFPGTKRLMTLKVVGSIGYSSTTNFVQMMPLGWPWLIWSNLVPYATVWEKGKTMDFLETIVVYDIKVDRCSPLKWIQEALWVPKAKVFYWLWSKSRRFNIFKLLFRNNH